MAKRGTKPTPTYMRIVTGNPSKRPLPQHEPNFTDDVPTCPDFLNDVGRMEWDRISAELAGAGLMSSAYRGVLTVYCQAWSDFVEANRVVALEGMIVKKPDGSLAKHPMMLVKNQAMTMLLKSAAEFGLSPSAKSRVQAMERTPRDEFTDFLDQKTR